MTDQNLIVAPPAPLATVTFTPEAMAMREAALDGSALIGRVSTAQENQTAVEAQAELTKVNRLFERARKDVTDPLLAAQRGIKHTVDAVRRGMEQELLRLSKLIGDFQALELQKQRAAEAAAQKEASQLEKERMEAIAEAKSHEEVEAVQEHFNERAAIEAPAPVVPVRAEGQAVRTVWEIQSINEFQLSKARPDLVRRIEFDKAAINQELTRGVKLPGVVAREIVKSSVRIAPPRAAIEV